MGREGKREGREGKRYPFHWAPNISLLVHLEDLGSSYLDKANSTQLLASQAKRVGPPFCKRMGKGRGGEGGRPASLVKPFSDIDTSRSVLARRTLLPSKRKYNFTKVQQKMARFTSSLDAS